MRLNLTFIALLLSATVVFGQGNPPENEQEYEAAYAWRVRQTELYGVHIPKDIAEVFTQLNSLSDAKDREKFRNLTETEAATRPFFSLGRWMAVNWGFYGGSRLTVYLNGLGLHDPDDMARFLLVMYNRHLNNRALDPKPIITGLIDARKAAEAERLLQGEVISKETHIKKGGN